MAFRHVEKPYKTCRKWRLLGAIFENDPKNPQNTGKTSVSATRFRDVENLTTPTKKAVSQKPKTRCGNPYKTCLKLIVLSEKGEMDSKIIKFLVAF